MRLLSRSGRVQLSNVGARPDSDAVLLAGGHGQLRDCWVLKVSIAVLHYLVAVIPLQSIGTAMVVTQWIELDP